jgi:hypothetical protein
MKRKILSLAASLLALLVVAPAQAQTMATFSVTASGTNPTVDSAIAFTTSIWEKYLVSTQPIKVNIFFWDLTSAGPLGITFPNGRRDFASAPLDSIWYPSCLANAISASETNPGESDIDIYMNASSTINWYFGTDANPSSGQYDFVSVLLHEIGHGLGFLSLAKSTSGNGSLGYLTSSDFFPLSPSFPWPDLQGKPSIYDYYIETTAGDHVADTSLYPNPGTALHGAFTSNGLWFNAPKSYAANSNVRVRLHAPTTFALGTSITHLNESTFPASNPSTLMTPFISKGEINHDPGPVTLGILEDIGWTISYPIAVDDAAPSLHLQAFPNPCVDQLHLRFTSDGTPTRITVMDAQGRSLESWEVNAPAGTSGITWDASDLATGFFLVRVENDKGAVVKKVVKALEE